MKDNKFKQSLISIIVPVYNVEKYLNRCIDSVLAQTFTDFELILVDDGSTDASGKICDEYSSKDSRIRVIHKQNGGLSDARNVGIEASIGDYLMFVDSDDWVAEDYVKLLYENLIATGADMSICGLNGLMPSGEIEYISSTINKDESVDAVEVCHRMTLDAGWHYICVVNKIFKRELFENIRFPKGKLHEDVFVAHHLFFKCNKISIIPMPLYFYRMREGSITHNKMTMDRAVNCFEHEIDRYSFYKKNKILDLQKFYLKSIYSKTLQVIDLMDSTNKSIVKNVLKQSLNTLKFNPRVLKCIFKYVLGLFI